MLVACRSGQFKVTTQQECDAVRDAVCALEVETRHETCSMHQKEIRWHAPSGHHQGTCATREPPRNGKELNCGHLRPSFRLGSQTTRKRKEADAFPRQPRDDRLAIVGPR